MEADIISEQEYFRFRLEIFETRLKNYMDDDKLDIILDDLKSQYQIGYIAFESFKKEKRAPRNKNKKLSILRRYKSDIVKLGVKDNIIALLETKIIYLWKIFEVTLKELIQTAYEVDNIDFYKFDEVKRFLKEYDIDISKLRHYNIIFDLLKVNNQCKHEGLKWIDKINHINEFNTKNLKKGNIPFEQIEKFYNRVKLIPALFLEEVKELIIDERFTFNQRKYIEIAEPIAKRMERKQAIEFMYVFLDLYNLKPENLNDVYLE